MKVTDGLIKNCLKNDRKAQQELYKSCYPILMNICSRYISNHDEARAIMNTGQLKILLNLEKYKNTIPFEAWIGRIMINTIIDDYRKNKQYKDKLDQVENLHELDELNNEFNENEADKYYDAEEILQLIHELPEDTRDIFNLFAIDGYSHKEIAAMLDVNEGTSRWHVSIARKDMQEKMKKKLNPDKNQNKKEK